jgi:hypothetical protein
VSRRTRQLTYYGEPPAPAPEPAARPDALWGFTLEDIHVAARRSAATFIGVLAADFSEQYDAAWHGVCELLLTAAQTPPVHDLNRAGWQAVSRHVNGERSSRGYDHRSGGGAGSMPAFVRYWHSPAHAPSPEDIVTDRLAVPQILATLPPRERQAIEALAA